LNLAIEKQRRILFSNNQHKQKEQQKENKGIFLIIPQNA